MLDLERLRIIFIVPKEIKLIVPSLEDNVMFSPPGCVTFYEDAFDARIRFPLHPFIKNILDFYMVTPTQFSPNGFRFIISFILTCDLIKIEPRYSSFRASLFHIEVPPYDKEWFYFAQH